MGKRSNFERIDKDSYDTIDPRAVQALSQHLGSGFTFIEPCAGKGLLIEAVMGIGARSCDVFFDIAPRASHIARQDALEPGLWDAMPGVDYIITNPPWSRPILHQMIEAFSDHAPTWLLFDADWAHTKQAEPYLKYCRKIVSVGRLKWIPGTSMSGKDNCAWYLFDQNADGQTEFFGRAAA